MNNFVLRILNKTPLDDIKKLKYYTVIRECSHILKYSHSMRKTCRAYGYLPTNQFYGHEYWLRKYAKYEKSICGLIEHGLTFGDNLSKDGIEIEWNIGNILTFGRNRANLLRSAYPGYNIVEIGPRIHYADINMEYLHELRAKIGEDSRNLVLFPAHSLSYMKVEQNREELIQKAVEIAKDYNYNQILVCLHPNDFKNGYDQFYKDRGFIIVTGGETAIDFLPRLKAIMEIADIMLSNSLGTHLGYGIYMGCPQLLYSQKQQFTYDKKTLEKGSCYVSPYSPIYEHEERIFAEAFSLECKEIGEITPAQKKIVDEYWGMSSILQPDEMREQLAYCWEYYRGRKNG